MTPEWWQAVGDLFDEALALPPGQREAWLKEKCNGDSELHKEVLSLLQNHEQVQGGFVQDHIKDAVVSFATHDTSGDARVGPYKLVRELGRGGMGTVYLAERDDDQYQTQVAIKLVRPGMDTEFILSRFKRERQTLARLQHPNIARLLDGGTTESGRPYIVMEFVDGPAITDYVRANDLSVEETLELFIQVCSAIDYAHRNFVVHRDLKPGNILVDPGGTPKLLDFGICKLLYSDPLATAETSAGLLTPDYASPEQVRGDAVTIASDVYSLGAVLYELLTGARPHRISKYTPQAIERAICEEDVVRPSMVPVDKMLARQLAGDLDNIVLRALEKEPERRYESAAQLSADLRRYLDNEPVHARPSTLRYRARKFARRNRGPLAAATAIVVTLIVAAGVSLREAYIARQRLEQVRSLANKFVFDVHDAVQKLPGATQARQLILQTGLQYLDAVAKDAKSDPAFEKELASAYRRIGDVQGNVASSNLGNTKLAIASYRKANALLEEAGRRLPRDSEVQVERLRVYHRLGNIAAAEKGLQDAVTVFKEGIVAGEAFLTQSTDPDLRWELGNIYIDLAAAFRNQGRYQETLEAATKASALFDEAHKVAPDRIDGVQALATANAAVGMALGQMGRPADALVRFHTGAAQMERVVASDPKNVLNRRELMLAYAHIADALGNPSMQSLGDAAGALQMYRKAAAIGKSIHESDPADQRAAMDYAIALSRVSTMMPDSDGPAKLEVERESLSKLRGILEQNPRHNTARMYVAFVSDQMGDVLKANGDTAGAIAAYRDCVSEAESIMQRAPTSALIQFLKSSGKLAAIAGSAGRRKEAIALAEKAVKQTEDLAGNKSGKLILPRAYAALAGAYAALAKSPAGEASDRVQARTWYEKALDAWRTAQTDPGFGVPHKREMREVELALATLRPR